MNDAKQACSLHAKQALFSNVHDSYIHTGIPWLFQTDLDIATERLTTAPLTHAKMYLPQGTAETPRHDRWEESVSSMC